MRKVRVRKVRAYECWPREHPDWRRVVNAQGAGKARYSYWLDVTDPWPGIRLTDIVVRSLGAARTSEEFAKVADGRGLHGLRCGDRVRVRRVGVGTVTGYTTGANFTVVADGGRELVAHPADIEWPLVADDGVVRAGGGGA